MIKLYYLRKEVFQNLNTLDDLKKSTVYYYYLNWDFKNI